jgi:hypothetical protein
MKAAVLLFATALVAGCADNSVSLSILHLQAVIRPTCTAVVETPGAAVLGRDGGLLDVQYGRAYAGWPVVRNNMQSRIVGMGPELNSIDIFEFQIDVGPPGGATMQSYRVPVGAGRIDPGALSTIAIDILPVNVASNYVGSTAILNIKPRGKHLDQDITGAAFKFPINVCKSCLNYTQPCLLPKNTTLVGCFYWQDEGDSCCSDPAKGLVCGPDAISPT